VQWASFLSCRAFLEVDTVEKIVEHPLLDLDGDDSLCRRLLPGSLIDALGA